MTAPILTTTLRHQRRSLAWWSVAVAATVAMVASSYATVEGQDELDESLADLPAGVRALIGLQDGLTISSPAGFLQSQLFANLLPLLLSVLAIGLGARAIAGDEGRGYLTVIDTEPVTRRRIALERLGTLGVALAVTATTAAVVLVASLDPSGLADVASSAAAAAVAGAAAVAAVHGAVAFAVGAATGRSSAAIACASAYAAWGYLVLSLAQLADALAPLRWSSAWYWFSDASPVRNGWSDMALPLAIAGTVVVATCTAGIERYVRRDARG